MRTNQISALESGAQKRKPQQRLFQFFIADLLVAVLLAGAASWVYSAACLSMAGAAPMKDALSVSGIVTVIVFTLALCAAAVTFANSRKILTFWKRAMFCVAMCGGFWAVIAVLVNWGEFAGWV